MAGGGGRGAMTAEWAEFKRNTSRGPLGNIRFGRPLCR